MDCRYLLIIKCNLCKSCNIFYMFYANNANVKKKDFYILWPQKRNSLLLYYIYICIAFDQNLFYFYKIILIILNNLKMNISYVITYQRV
jgi:hypothetical protein